MKILQHTSSLSKSQLPCLLVTQIISAVTTSVAKVKWPTNLTSSISCASFGLIPESSAASISKACTYEFFFVLPSNDRFLVSEVGDCVQAQHQKPHSILNLGPA
jgi:hypothetical protein